VSSRFPPLDRPPVVFTHVRAIGRTTTIFSCSADAGNERFYRGPKKRAGLYGRTGRRRVVSKLLVPAIRPNIERVTDLHDNNPNRSKGTNKRRTT